MKLNEKLIYKHSGWMVPEEDIQYIPESDISYYKTETFEIYFSLKEGFNNKDEFLKFCNRNGINPSVFTILDVNGQIYAIAIENTSKQIILSKDRCYVRRSEWNSDNWTNRHLSGYEKECLFNDLNTLNLPTIKSARAGAWNCSFGNIMQEIFDITVIQHAHGVSSKIAIAMLYYILYDGTSNFEALCKHYDMFNWYNVLKEA